MMHVFEVHTIDVNGNSTRETSIREAIENFTSENRRTLRINIDGVVIKLEPGHWNYYDNRQDGKIILTGGIIIDI